LYDVVLKIFVKNLIGEDILTSDRYNAVFIEISCWVSGLNFLQWNLKVPVTQHAKMGVGSQINIQWGPQTYLITPKSSFMAYYYS
jgi:hypothetical protein